MGMTASVDDLFADVVDRTGRGDDLTSTRFSNTTDNNGILQQTLGDITSRWPFFEAVETATLTASTAYVAVPTNLRSIFGVTITSSGTVLREIPSMQVYLAHVAADDTEGTPTAYLVFKERIYSYPTANAETGLTVYCSKFTYTLSDLPDHFYEAVAEGCCWRVLRGLDQGAERGQPHRDAYEAEIAKLVQRYTRMRHPVEMIEV